MSQFFVTAENVREYLVRRGLVPPRQRVSAEELGGGVSNTVLGIDAGGHRWVVKQSLAKLRVKDDWRSDRARIFREAEAIADLRGVLGPRHLPEIVHVDRENFLFIMTAAPMGSVVWKECLMAGRPAGRGVASEAGRMLAQMVNASRASALFQEKFRDPTVFDQLRVDPYYRTTGDRHPELGQEFRELVHIALATKLALVHGDYSPKNMLVAGGKIFLIDFECVHWGDPAFDAGFLINHLFLKAFHQPGFAKLYFEAVDEFWSTLAAGLGEELIRDFEQRTLRHLGGLMLARVDGKSPVEYIRDEETRNRVRGAAKRILIERPRQLDAAKDMVATAIREA